MATVTSSATPSAAKPLITFAQLQEHTSKDNLWILLHKKVYDVTKFVDEHPGGDEVMLAEKGPPQLFGINSQTDWSHPGRDASEAFEDVGHSDEARSLLDAMLVGDFDTNGPLKVKSIPAATSIGVERPQQGSILPYLIPLAFIIAYTAYRMSA
ncbi:cytochrome b5 [Sistotremastrum suecicum HHB10207 ss-3]|uniref:Cytochrome b5 n=1 Tax=Sistotremastrum suecicum HHB10207 ss-3 TaxID=1314776 RepID=A0A166HQ33_9AGAM|nr:cytochrome b5 [Sistotremastrum suecicum HHB10207 ss-3]